MIQRIPKLIRFLAFHAILGVLVGFALAGALIAFDVAGLGTLIAKAEDPITATILLFFGFAVTFGSAVMGGAILMYGER